MNTHELNLNLLNEPTKHTPAFTNQKHQLYILVLFSTVLFVSCKSGPDNGQNDSSQISSGNIPAIVTQNDTIAGIVKSLIYFSANDFYKHQKPLPTAFRKLQIKYVIKSNKELMYLLCGQFTTDDKQNSSEWTDFTTIITDPYEQWIGSNALTYCENSKEIQFTKANLSAELIMQLNSLQKTEK